MRWYCVVVSLLLCGCGEGEATERAEPSAEPITRFTLIAAGGDNVCGLDLEGHAWCAGSALSARRGPFTSLEVGSFHACALDASRLPTCWGDDEEGSTRLPAEPFDRLALGHDLTCGLQGGRARCWGSNRWGRGELPPGAYQELGAGWGFACALDELGAPRCSGEEGLVEQTPAVRGLRGLRLGDAHACALDADGAARCWGNDDAGRTRAPAGPLTALALGGMHGCGLDRAGELQCWGALELGLEQIPRGAFVQVVSGRHHACARRADGSVECWGLGPVQGRLEFAR